MTWIRHSDDFSSHPKVMGLSDKAYRLHFCALEVCARFLTDGVVDDRVLRLSGSYSGLARPLYQSRELVKSGLWEQQEPRKWLIHDYLEYNPSKAEIQQARENDRQRQARWRAARNAVTNGGTNAVSPGAPSRPVSSSKELHRDTRPDRADPKGTNLTGTGQVDAASAINKAGCTHTQCRNLEECYYQ